MTPAFQTRNSAFFFKIKLGSATKFVAAKSGAATKGAAALVFQGVVAIVDEESVDG